MNKALSVLNDHLTFGRQEYKRSTELFLELDIGRMKQNMRLVERGRQRGAQEQPPTLGKQLDGVEHEVLNAVATDQRRASNTFDNEMRTYAERLSKVDIRGHASDIELTVRNAVSDFVASTKQALTDLHRAQQKAQESIEHYTVFKNQNGL